MTSEQKAKRLVLIKKRHGTRKFWARFAEGHEKLLATVDQLPQPDTRDLKRIAEAMQIEVEY